VSLLSNSCGASKPILCYVTDRNSVPLANSTDSIEGLMRKIAEVAAAGVDWVQIREKDLKSRELASLTREALRSTAQSSSGMPHPVRVIVNDRLDIALAEHAGGVHLGEKGLPVREAKRLQRSNLEQRAGANDFLVGVSCHSMEAAEVAQREGADYIFFGPIFATPSKERFGPPQGAERLKQVCRAVSIPVLAIGGIALENAAACLYAGAAGVAAIRLFQEAADPKHIVDSLRRITD
jgi:thiamine-phosphate pyrophosphorylase